jgi:hypothetical protein
MMLFLFPIGFYFYFFVERKNRPAYEKVFDDFQRKIQDNTALSNKQKVEPFQKPHHIIFTLENTLKK